MTTPADAARLLRSRSYLSLLVLAAIIGAPISALAYFFLWIVDKLQRLIFTSAPHELGFHSVPLWWPVPPLLVSGVLVGLVIRYLPGGGGHSPVDGLSTKGTPTPAQLPGVVLAALATLSLGAVLGPEAPLIALGGGLAVCAIRLARRDSPAQAQAMVAAAGSFASISTLLGSPIVGAFLLMEAGGLGGASMELVLVPGLLASGVGALIFTGLDDWTGLGTFSLAIPHLPHLGHPDIGEFGWAVVIGLAAALLGTSVRRLGRLIRPHIESRLLIATPAAGLVVAGLAAAYGGGTGRSVTEVLFSGQSAVPGLVANAAGYTVGALLLLLACKGLAYACSLAAFRGGPIFPALFLGAAGGVAMSHLPGLPVVAGIAMGMGAMSAVMLRLPMTSVLLATLLLFSDGLVVMPLVIVAVVVAYVAAAWISNDTLPGGSASASGAATSGGAGGPGGSGGAGSSGSSGGAGAGGASGGAGGSRAAGGARNPPR
ncbi:MAG TPA: chloride channel protein [Streptosporangiaceae bacterium]|nr:chloride channel protein [Streptosporangiaceae bacterium]